MASGRILLLWICLLQLVWAQRWPRTAEQSLSSGRILEARSLEQVVLRQGQEWQGSSSIWLLQLENGVQGVFRSEDEPWGSQAEVFAYRFDQWLGSELVPPSAVRTIAPGEWPGAWPFPPGPRVGSLQWYVESHTPSQAEWLELAGEDRANAEILSFVLGRYDNHLGNVLVGADGRLSLVDFENCLELEQARYGLFPFIRRGRRRPDLPSLEAGSAFPFEQPARLEHPALEEIQRQFGPWWTIWPEGMRQLARRPEVRYAVWDHCLWVEARAGSRHPAFTEAPPVASLQRLAALDVAQLQKMLLPPFSQAHIEGFLERARQVLLGKDQGRGAGRNLSSSESAKLLPKPMLAAQKAVQEIFQPVPFPTTLPALPPLCSESAIRFSDLRDEFGQRVSQAGSQLLTGPSPCPKMNWPSPDSCVRAGGDLRGPSQQASGTKSAGRFG